MKISEIHRSQELRHIVANKLTLPLTVLRYLLEGKTPDPQLIQKAIADLEAMMQDVDKALQIKPIPQKNRTTAPS